MIKNVRFELYLKRKKYYLNHIPVNTKDHHHLHVEYYDMKKVKEIKE